MGKKSSCPEPDERSGENGLLAEAKESDYKTKTTKEAGSAIQVLHPTELMFNENEIVKSKLFYKCETEKQTHIEANQQPIRIRSDLMVKQRSSKELCDACLKKNVSEVEKSQIFLSRLNQNLKLNRIDLNQDWIDLNQQQLNQNSLQLSQMLVQLIQSLIQLDRVPNWMKRILIMLNQVPVHVSRSPIQLNRILIRLIRYLIRSNPKQNLIQNSHSVVKQKPIPKSCDSVQLEEPKQKSPIELNQKLLIELICSPIVKQEPMEETDALAVELNQEPIRVNCDLIVKQEPLDETYTNPAELNQEPTCVNNCDLIVKQEPLDETEDFQERSSQNKAQEPIQINGDPIVKREPLESRDEPVGQSNVWETITHGLNQMNPLMNRFESPNRFSSIPEKVIEKHPPRLDCEKEGHVEQFKCVFCGQCVENREELKTHVLEHTDSLSYQSRIRSDRVLKDHRRGMHWKRPWEGCGLCQIALLGIEPRQCPPQGKQLEGWNRNTYNCDICQTELSQKERQYLEEDPSSNKCTFCDAVFWASQDSLKLERSKQGGQKRGNEGEEMIEKKRARMDEERYSLVRAKAMELRAKVNQQGIERAEKAGKAQNPGNPMQCYDNLNQGNEAMIQCDQNPFQSYHNLIQLNQTLNHPFQNPIQSYSASIQPTQYSTQFYQNSDHFYQNQCETNRTVIQSYQNPVQSYHIQSEQNWIEWDQNQAKRNWIEWDQNQAKRNWIEWDQNQAKRNWIEWDQNQAKRNWIESYQNHAEQQNWVDSYQNHAEQQNWVDSYQNHAEQQNWVDSYQNPVQYYPIQAEHNFLQSYQMQQNRI